MKLHEEFKLKIRIAIAKGKPLRTAANLYKELQSLLDNDFNFMYNKPDTYSNYKRSINILTRLGKR